MCVASIAQSLVAADQLDWAASPSVGCSINEMVGWSPRWVVACTLFLSPMHSHKRSAEKKRERLAATTKHGLNHGTLSKR